MQKYVQNATATAYAVSRQSGPRARKPVSPRGSGGVGSGTVGLKTGRAGARG